MSRQWTSHPSSTTSHLARLVCDALSRQQLACTYETLWPPSPTYPPSHKQPTANFSTADASGSTSQAANIIEALEVGSTALLIDEDTSATNLLIRDAMMQARGLEI